MWTLIDSGAAERAELWVPSSFISSSGSVELRKVTVGSCCGKAACLSPQICPSVWWPWCGLTGNKLFQGTDAFLLRPSPTTDGIRLLSDISRLNVGSLNKLYCYLLKNKLILFLFLLYLSNLEYLWDFNLLFWGRPDQESLSLVDVPSSSHRAALREI